MNCPFCGNPESKVTDSRPDEAGIRRRRECL
ncbi:MAG: transcriptional regulator NrdR, partial [Dehalococcoidia bacterium]